MLANPVLFTYLVLELILVYLADQYITWCFIYILLGGVKERSHTAVFINKP